jgi:hypothetical protein
VWTTAAIGDLRVLLRRPVQTAFIARQTAQVHMIHEGGGLDSDSLADLSLIHFGE